MKIAVYENFPEGAKEVRKEVFMKEQGFQNEFDEIDKEATHVVVFDDEEVLIATCRVFWDVNLRTYVLGRLAVNKEYRGKQIGSMLLKEVERYVQKKGGKEMVLHAQCRVTDFYKKSGFMEFGKVENDEGCPHVWMKKIMIGG